MLFFAPLARAHHLLLSVLPRESAATTGSSSPPEDTCWLRQMDSRGAKRRM